MNLKTFCINKHITYQEFNVNSPIINKFYEIYNPRGESIVAIPDGCIDIEFVWKNGKMNSLLCGSLIQGIVSDIGVYDYCFGIKFNPGMLPNNFRLNVNDVINSRCNLHDFINAEEIENKLLQIGLFEDKVNYFLEMFDGTARKMENEVITSYIFKEINKCNGFINVTKMVENSGYSHCYIDRVFKNNVGFSIKKYANIVRLQKSIDILMLKNEECVFEKLGYYDQAHFIKDFKKFTMITPKVYIKKKDGVRIV